MRRPWVQGAALKVPLGPAVCGLFDVALLSLQGDRGFDGLAGLPGEKGHRVSICCGIWGGSFLPTASGSFNGARFLHVAVSLYEVLWLLIE